MQAANPVTEIADVVAQYGGETLHACMQCGTCTSVCPWGLVNAYSPRQILRQVSLDGVAATNARAVFKDIGARGFTYEWQQTSDDGENWETAATRAFVRA